MSEKSSKEKTASRYWPYLIYAGAILVPLAGLVWWIYVDLLNTDKYVSLITPVVQNPAVQESLTNFLNDTIFQKVDTTAIIKNAFPNQSETVVQLLNDALVNLSHNRILTIVQSPRFAVTWGNVNEVLHQQVSKLLLGQGQALTLQNGEVVINLSSVSDQLKAGLSDKGLSNLAAKVPPTDYNYVLFKAPLLTKYQPLVHTIDSLFPWIQFLVVILFGAAIWLSPDRPKSIDMIGRALLIDAAFIAFTLLVVRGQYLDQSFGQYFTKDVAAVFFDAITKPLWLQVFALTLFGIFGIVTKRYLSK